MLKFKFKWCQKQKEHGISDVFDSLKRLRIKSTSYTPDCVPKWILSSQMDIKKWETDES